MIGEVSFFKGALLEYRAQNRWFVFIILLFMSFLGIRFFQLQVMGGKKYEKLAEINQVKRTRIPPRRGEILDRHGRALATNIDLYRIVIVPHYVDDIDDVLARLQSLVRLTDEKIETVRNTYYDYISDKKKRFFEIEVKRYVNGSACPQDGTTLEEVDNTHYHWCKQCGAEFIILPKTQKECPFDKTPLETRSDGKKATCPQCARQFVFERSCPDDGTPLLPHEHHLRCPRCRKDFSDDAAVLQARLHQFPGVYVREQVLRAYPFGELFAHIVGYVNEVTAEEVALHPEVYRPGDLSGRRGVEKTMEEVLRGKPGEEVMFRDRKGRKMQAPQEAPTLANLKYEPAVPGNNVVLTLDVEVQRILQDAVKDVHSAGIVVMNVHNGEVLGMFSTPTFDPNEWSGRLTPERKKEYDDNPYYPMINKATTAFPPASTFKIVSAIAALNTGTINYDTKINCPGFYDYAGHRFGCYNKYGHGDMDLRRAISLSCDVFFYRIGEWLGMDRLEEYATRLGLGKRTGIEIGEEAGVVPSREWHEQHSQGGFQPGFTLSTAVGQKDIRATPLQMAMVLSEVVNGGFLVHPHLVERIEDMQGVTVRTLSKPQGEPLGIPVEYLDFLRQSMIGTIEDPDGTGYGSRLESIRMGGKTGTAEARQIKKGVDPYVAQWLAEDHAWVVVFAPADDPMIAVAIIVEHGGFGGAVAGPIATKVVYRLFSQNLVPGPTEAQP